ncbi:MAG: AMP-binding protein, partial [Cyclobacteriaceae bacterium]|nr:AMP-binding protein [Cyclobacteriaceae bacterium HetDA_MAG_MS6]
MTSPRLLWTPDPTFQAESHLVQYQNWLAENYHLHFSNYDQLWQWSVDHTKAFWQSIVEYFQVNFHQPYSAVHSDDPMPDTSWFPGATVSYAEHIFRQSNEKHPALLFQSETQPLTPMSWTELREHVAAFQSYLTSIGVGEGDRVVAFIPNIPEATVAFLAVNGLGAVWSSCSPDFGSASIIDRFQQIKPKVLITVDGYRYGGKAFDKQHVVREVVAKLTALEKVVTIPYLNEESGAFIDGADTWQEAIDRQADLVLRPVPFDHPIWILYSSGTTGQPKAITHSTGGVLLEHLKYVSFHNDVKPGERFFWYTTTGWMMWNYLHATMLAGATLVLVDGSPSYPDMGILWKL